MTALPLTSYQNLGGYLGLPKQRVTMSKQSPRQSDPICLIACGTAARTDTGQHVRAMWGLSARCCNTLPPEHCASPEDLAMDWCEERAEDPQLDSWNGIIGNRRTWNKLKRVLLYTHAHKKFLSLKNIIIFSSFIFFNIHRFLISHWPNIYKKSTAVDCRFYSKRVHN